MTLREFFKEELKTLHLKTGLQQYFKLQEMENWEKQFEILLNSLELACKEFHYIPDAEKQKIIAENIIRDQNYTSLNSRVVWGWLNANKNIYWECQSDYQEITREPAAPEVAEKYIDQLFSNIAKIGKPANSFPVNQTQRDSGNTIVTGKEYIAYKANLQKFICDGIEIPAVDEASARKQYKQALGVDPEQVTSPTETKQP